jgi:hypothetical protein
MVPEVSRYGTFWKKAACFLSLLLIVLVFAWTGRSLVYALGTAPGETAAYIVNINPPGNAEVFRDKYSEEGRLKGRGWQIAGNGLHLMIHDKLLTHNGTAYIQFADDNLLSPVLRSIMICANHHTGFLNSFKGRSKHLSKGGDKCRDIQSEQALLSAACAAKNRNWTMTLSVDACWSG